MKIEAGFNPDIVWVLVDAGELQCDVCALPYLAWIGTINTKTGKIVLWYPAARKPRGYKKAAELKLREARTQIMGGSK